MIKDTPDFQECPDCGCEFPNDIVRCPNCRYNEKSEPRRMRDYD